MSITRNQADLMALEFLRDSGPHTMGPIEDEGAIGAMLIFLDLTKRGLVSKTDFGGGNLQFTITPAGATFSTTQAGLTTRGKTA